jgi:hypothetical protein
VLSKTSVRIDWTTDLAANGYIQFNILGSSEYLRAETGDPATSHSVTLIPLSTGLTYQYFIFQQTLAGASANSATSTFIIPGTARMRLRP